MKKKISDGSGGFTLVELLLVVGVLSILIGLLTPAIIKSMKTVLTKQQANEQRVLEAGIMEYWHDQNKWPLPAGVKPKKADGYKVTYYEDNYLVFDELINVVFAGTRKDYLDPANHTTTEEKVTEYPAFTAANLKDVLEGNSEKNISKRQNPVLVYWSNEGFLKCPSCGEIYKDSTKECSNDKCPYWTAQSGDAYPARYAFKSADRNREVRVLLPYKVTFDLLNNTVSVYQ